MGPLVPEIISEEVSLLIAFLLGIGFGFVLEQAGFSSTKKLVGLFYGYDFTVLKVFFTAGVTAMTGVLVLSHFSLLDLNFIFVNPTFLWSALVGGVIMGGGFIIGGFCPGTSLCAAAVGKIDAMAFIGGSFLGILAFMEGYPLFKDLYLAENLGAVTIYDMLSISKETFGFILTSVAVFAFVVTAKIEDHVNGITQALSWKRVFQYATIALLPFLLVSLVAYTPSENQRLLKEVDYKIKSKKENIKTYDVDKLAFALLNNRHQINFIHVGTAEEFKKFNVPASINIPFDSLLNREFRSYFKQQYKTNVFYAEDVDLAKKAYLLASEIGNAETFVLNEPVSSFQKLIFEPTIPAPPATKAALDTYNFRLMAGNKLKKLEDALKNVKPAKKQLIKANGGCS